jgi:hypothetical protein
MCAVEKALIIKTRQSHFGAQKRITELTFGCMPTYEYSSYRNNKAEIEDQDVDGRTILKWILER